jgi:DnaJ-class molecular chaperone
MSSTKDTILYDRLEVRPNATTDEITKAGRKMSMKWHPDKHLSNKEEAEAKFKEIREALDILSDPHKRSQYDQVGLDGINGKNIDQDHGFPQGFPQGFPFPFPGGFRNPFMNPSQHQQHPQPEPIVHHLSVSLEQIAKEELVYFNYSHHINCAKCDGNGATDSSKIVDCAMCRGTGTCTRIQQMGHVVQHISMPCEACDRKGKTIEKGYKCNRCAGKGYVKTTTNANIKLQTTIDDDMKLKLEKKGHQTKQGSGDLIVVIHIEPHEAFDRRGCHLITQIELTLYEALFGFTKTVYHLDGRKVRIQHCGKTDYGTYRKMVGEGFKNVKNVKNVRAQQQGNLYIYFTFTLPEIKTVEQILDDIKDDSKESVKESKESKESDDSKDDNDFEYSALLDIDENDRQELKTPSSSPRFANRENNNGGNGGIGNGGQNPQECRPM